MEAKEIKLTETVDDEPAGNPVYVDGRGNEYEIDWHTGAHRRLTPKKIDKRIRRRIRKQSAK